MAAKIQYLTYYIVLTDPVAVAAYQALYPTGVNRAIYDSATAGGAAVEFSAPFRGYEQPAAGGAPYTWTPWSGLGSNAGPYPINVATFTRHTGGFWGIGGTTTTYYWMGQFVYLPPGPTTTAAVPQRRFIQGFDFSTGGSAVRSRDAARHVGGIGHALRDSTFYEEFAQDLYGAALTNKTWERVYVRLRRAGSVPVPFWRAVTDDGSSGVQLTIQTSGQIGIEDRLLASRVTIGSAGQLTVGEWVKLDMIVEFNTAAVGGTGRLRVWKNGTLQTTVSVVGAVSGLGNFAATHNTTRLGNVDALSSHGCELDLDDWIASEIPNVAGVESLTSLDWLSGTKIALCRPDSFGAAHANWTGDVRVVMKDICPPPAGVAQATLTSSVTLALAEVVTDAAVVVGQDTGSRGVLSAKPILHSSRGAASGTLGYTIAGGAPVNAAVTQAGTLSTTSVMYRPSGLTAPATITPFNVRHTKGAGADAATISVMAAEVEMVGAWGGEDVQPGTVATTFPVFIGQHNAPYPRTQWAIDAKSGPIAPVIIFAGTYTGNGTGQDLSFRAPVNFFYARRNAAGGDPKWWASAMLGLHLRNLEYFYPDAFTRGKEDQTFAPAAGVDTQSQRYLIRLSGADTEVNQNAVVYQYIAVCDPGMRYMVNGAFQHSDSAIAPITNVLANADFVPEWAFCWEEDANGGVSPSMSVKSLGHAVDAVSYVHGLTQNNLTFATGALVSQAAMHTALAGGEKQAAYSCWRRHDGNGDPGEAAIVSFGSYTGDGNASRSLNIGTAGKRPLLALVVSAAGAAQGYVRDPSHTGTISVGMDDGIDSAAAGITAGAVDGLTVGANLNTNAVLYHYFILWGSATAGNNGFSINGEYIPVEANSPADGPWPSDPSVPTTSTPPVTPPVEQPDLDSSTVLPNTTLFCLDYSTRIVNRALSRIGINKRVTALATENTELADVARLHLKDDIEATLRAFPWAFATAYNSYTATHAGSDAAPVSNDWVASYLLPTDCVFARRIATEGVGRKSSINLTTLNSQVLNDSPLVNSAPPIPFRQGLDQTLGPLLFCNTVATTADPLVLEYTRRVQCPSYFGDAIFHEALVWKHAASLAPALSRDSAKQNYCLQMFDIVLNRAKTVDAREQQQEPDGEADWISGRG